MRILMDERGKKYLIYDQEFHSDFGFIKKEVIQKSRVGDVLRTHLGRELKVINADVNDYIELMERKCSIILPKDVGMIISYTGLGCGDRVVDAGTGAGAAAMYFANIVGEAGKVYSYEIREDFVEIASRNIESFGLDNVKIKCRDITKGIDERDVDLIFLDLPKPYDVIEYAEQALKNSGYISTYSPYIDQIQILHKILKKFNFSSLHTVECMVRDIEVKNKGTRPKTRMIGHTGYLTFARKL